MKGRRESISRSHFFIIIIRHVSHASGTLDSCPMQCSFVPWTRQVFGAVDLILLLQPGCAMGWLAGWLAGWGQSFGWASRHPRMLHSRPIVAYHCRLSSLSSHNSSLILTLTLSSPPLSPPPPPPPRHARLRQSKQSFARDPARLAADFSSPPLDCNRSTSSYPPDSTTLFDPPVCGQLACFHHRRHHVSR